MCRFTQGRARETLRRPTPHRQASPERTPQANSTPRPPPGPGDRPQRAPPSPSGASGAGGGASSPTLPPAGRSASSAQLSEARPGSAARAAALRRRRLARSASARRASRLAASEPGAAGGRAERVMNPMCGALQNPSTPPLASPRQWGIAPAPTPEANASSAVAPLWLRGEITPGENRFRGPGRLKPKGFSRARPPWGNARGSYLEHSGLL